MLKKEDMELLLSIDGDIKSCNGTLFRSITMAIENNDRPWLRRLSYAIIRNHLNLVSLIKSCKDAISNRDDIKEETLNLLNMYYEKCTLLEDKCFALLKKKLSTVAPEFLDKALSEHGMA